MGLDVLENHHYYVCSEAIVKKIPIALASGDDAKSIPDVLACWADDLKTSGIKFSNFDKTFKYYRAIQAKVDTEAQKTSGKIGDLAGKAASKTVEAVAIVSITCYFNDLIHQTSAFISQLLVLLAPANQQP